MQEAIDYSNICNAVDVVEICSKIAAFHWVSSSVIDDFFSKIHP